MPSSPPVRSQSRIFYLDLLRAVASFGILFLHLAPLTGHADAVSALPWQIVTVVKAFARWCVPVFLMISGALFLSPDRPFSVKRLYRKSIARILVSFFVWSAFYALVHCVLMGKGKWTFLNQLLRGHYHMWFLLAILGLYMLTPLLRRMTASNEATRYFLVLGLLFAFLIPQATGALSLFPLPHGDILQSARSFLSQANPLSGAYMLVYFVLGYFLHAAPAKKGVKFPAALLASLSLLLTILLTLRLSLHLGAPDFRFCEPNSVFVLGMSVGVFLLAKHAVPASQPSEKAARIVHHLSDCALGVYLMHPFFVERLQVALPASAVGLIAGLLLEAAVFYLLSVAVSTILRRVPVLGKWIV